MAKVGEDILITPYGTSYDPQILFRGSGTDATGLALNVQTGSVLSFSGAYGEVLDCPAPALLLPLPPYLYILYIAGTKSRPQSGQSPDSL